MTRTVPSWLARRVRMIDHGAGGCGRSMTAGVKEVMLLFREFQLMTRA